MTERPRREKREDERFCSECGEPVKRAAVVCVHCGVPLRPSVRGPGARSGTGLEPRVAASLCYVLTWLTGLIFLLVEKDDEYVRFHAMQAIAFGVASVILWVVCLVFTSLVDNAPAIGGILSGLAWAAFVVTSLILWIVLIIKAYQGDRFKLWILGDLADRWATGAAR